MTDTMTELREQLDRVRANIVRMHDIAARALADKAQMQRELDIAIAALRQVVQRAPRSKPKDWGDYGDPADPNLRATGDAFSAGCDHAAWNAAEHARAALEQIAEPEALQK